MSRQGIWVQRNIHNVVISFAFQIIAGIGSSVALNQALYNLNDDELNAISFCLNQAIKYIHQFQEYCFGHKLLSNKRWLQKCAKNTRTDGDGGVVALVAVGAWDTREAFYAQTKQDVKYIWWAVVWLFRIRVAFDGLCHGRCFCFN